jgi:hypothetical protein
MKRREFLKYSAATAAAAPSVRAARADSGVVNVGIVAKNSPQICEVTAIRNWLNRK